MLHQHKISLFIHKQSLRHVRHSYQIVFEDGSPDGLHLWVRFIPPDFVWVVPSWIQRDWWRKGAWGFRYQTSRIDILPWGCLCMKKRGGLVYWMWSNIDFSSFDSVGFPCCWAELQKWSRLNLIFILFLYFSILYYHSCRFKWKKLVIKTGCFHAGFPLRTVIAKWGDYWLDTFMRW